MPGLLRRRSKGRRCTSATFSFARFRDAGKPCESLGGRPCLIRLSPRVSSRLKRPVSEFPFRDSGVFFRLERKARRTASCGRCSAVQTGQGSPGSVFAFCSRRAIPVRGSSRWERLLDRGRVSLHSRSHRIVAGFRVGVRSGNFVSEKAGAFVLGRLSRRGRLRFSPVSYPRVEKVPFGDYCGRCSTSYGKVRSPLQQD